MPVAHQAGRDQQQQVAEIGREQRHDVGRRRQVDEQHHDDRQRADDHRRRLGFRRQRLDLLAQQFARTQHVRQVAERFGEVAARLLLDVQHDVEEVHFLRSACAGTSCAAPDRAARPSRSHRHTTWNSAASGCGLSRAIIRRHSLQRQAGFHAAHDHVDGVGELADEFLLAARDRHAENPARQAETRRKRRCPPAPAPSRLR